VKATTDGNILPAIVGPSALGITVACPPSKMAAAEFVVPKSIPKTFWLFFGVLNFFFSPIFCYFDGLATRTIAGRNTFFRIR
jgi:hypothetical protein